MSSLQHTQEWQLRARTYADLISGVFAGLIVVVGASVLLGHALGMESLTTVLPGAVTMKPATAMLFIFQGVSTITFISGFDRRSHGVVILTIIASLFVLIAALWAPEKLAVAEQPDIWTARPGLPSLGTLTAFLLALAIDAEDLRDPRSKLAPIFAKSIIAIGGIAVIGYLTQIPALFFHWKISTAMAIHTALGFLVLGTAKYLALRHFQKKLNS